MSDCLFLFKCLKRVLQNKYILHSRPSKAMLDLLENSPFFLRCGKGMGSTKSVGVLWCYESNHLNISVKHLKQSFTNQTL